MVSFGSFRSLEMLAPVRQPGARHGLTQAALFNERLLQRLELPIQQEARHFDQTQDDVGADDGVGVFNAFPESVEVCARSAIEVA